MKTLLPWKDSNFAAKTRQEKFLAVFPWIWLIAVYCGTIAFLWSKCRGYIDSDMSAEMVLADLLNQEGGLLSTNWWYSTEIRVFYLQIFYRLGLLLFPKDWFAARVFGQALWMATLIAAYLYVGRGLHLRGDGIWGAAVLVCPFGMWYFRYGWLGGFYVPHMLLILLSFGVLLRLIQNASRLRRAVQCFFLLVLCVISGLNGIKGIMGLYLPQCAAAALLLLYQWRKAPEYCPRMVLRYLLVSLASLAAAGAGYWINGHVLAQTHYFTSYNESAWGQLDFSKLLRSWADLLSLFGYPCDSYFSLNVPLFSLRGILGAFGYLLAILFVIFLASLLRKLPDMPLEQQIFPMLVLCIIVVQGSICAFTSGEVGNNATYWLSVLPFCVTVYVMGIERADFRLPHGRQAATVGLLLCFAATSVSTVSTHLIAEAGQPYVKTISDWLVEQGYTKGFANFYLSNELTEWSSGQLEMWTTEEPTTMEPYEWLQKRSHLTPPEGEVFYFVNRNTDAFASITALAQTADIVFDDGTYYVFAFDNYEEMMVQITAAQA